MPDPRRLDHQQAAQRRRAWLQQRHTQARELVILLLRHAPEAKVTRVLDQLPAGDLQRLARLLTHATNPQQQPDEPAGTPPGQPGPTTTTPTHP